MSPKVTEVETDPDAQDFFTAARNIYAINDETEIDDEPLLSRGDDGAFVSAWVWVSNEQAGIIHCEECGERTTEAGDGWCGLCPDCADKADG
jgi:hypothetical protein